MDVLPRTEFRPSALGFGINYWRLHLYFNGVGYYPTKKIKEGLVVNKLVLGKKGMPLKVGL